jgi:hypothetical protein
MAVNYSGIILEHWPKNKTILNTAVIYWHILPGERRQQGKL